MLIICGSFLPPFVLSGVHVLLMLLVRLVIRTSRTVGSAKKFVRITSVLLEESSRRRFARYIHVKNWNLLFYCSNIAKSDNAMLWRMLSRLETCIVYCCIWSVTLAKSIVPRKHDENCDTHTFLSCSWQRCKLNFQYFFIMGV